jgi:diguanylate cyclase (GGDEF)-like protein
VDHLCQELLHIESSVRQAAPPTLPWPIILENLPLALALCDPKTGRYLFANASFCELFQYAGSQWQQHSWHDLLGTTPGSLTVDCSIQLGGRLGHLRGLPVQTDQAHYQLIWVELIAPTAEAARLLQQQQQLRKTLQAIRKSLDLEVVSATTVQEVRQFLAVDWVHLLAYDATQQGWHLMATSDPTVAADRFSEAEVDWVPQCRRQMLWLPASDEDSGSAAWLAYFPGAWCLLPLYLTTPTAREGSPELWGILAVGGQTAETLWDESTLEFAETLGQEVAIAIQQSLLYQELQRSNQELQALALTDGLTQLANRRQFDQHLENEWQRLTREQKPLSLILCDIDYFKRYNDCYGHPAGDRCLEQVAQALMQSSQRPADLIARYGGEEFAVILPNTDTQGAYRVAQKIRQGVQALAVPHESSDVSPWVTVTMGLATIVPERHSSAQDLLQAADLALYHAKQQGRDRIYAHALYTYPKPPELLA